MTSGLHVSRVTVRAWKLAIQVGLDLLACAKLSPQRP